MNATQKGKTIFRKQALYRLQRLWAASKDGKYDVDFIRAFGITVNPKNYFVLGDNHAMSGDGRLFGFVPDNNLQGAPSLILGRRALAGAFRSKALSYLCPPAPDYMEHSSS